MCKNLFIQKLFQYLICIGPYSTIGIKFGNVPFRGGLPWQFTFHSVVLLCITFDDDGVDDDDDDEDDEDDDGDDDGDDSDDGNDTGTHTNCVTVGYLNLVEMYGNIEKFHILVICFG